MGVAPAGFEPGSWHTILPERLSTLGPVPRILGSSVAQRLSRPLRDHLERHTTRVAHVQVGVLRSETSQDRLRSERAAREFVDALERVRSSIRDVEDDRASILAELAHLRGELSLARKMLHETKLLSSDALGLAEIATRESAGNSTVLNLMFGPEECFASRLPTTEMLTHLVDELDKVVPNADIMTSLSQAFRTMIELELRGIGRIAGSLPNILGKLSAIALLRPASGQVLAIGTLFGIATAGVARQLSRIGLDYHVTIIDPFTGYHVESDQDGSFHASLVPATRQVVMENLSLGGIDERRYRVVEGLSTSPEVRAETEMSSYGLVLIDGDHSEDGTLEDLVWVQSLVVPGALVVLDSYGDPAWPGVERALQTYLTRSDAALTMIGSVATTAFLRASRADERTVSSDDRR